MFYFKRLYEDLASDLSGDFKEAVLSLLDDKKTYLAKEAYRAITATRVDYYTLAQIICIHPSEEVDPILDRYEQCKFYQ